jgi:hypothetical protein
MKTATVRLKGNGIQVMAAAGRFRGFKPIDENPVRTTQVKVDKLVEAFSSFHCGGDATEEAYERAEKTAKGMEYSAADIEGLSLSLATCSGHLFPATDAGLFLSALINNSREERFVLRLEHLEERLHYLGFHNTKSIMVHGSVGKHSGRGMASGHMVIKGDAGGFAGDRMKGGTIVVENNAASNCGHEMSGGKIVVKGDAHMPGLRMCGGKLILLGKTSMWVGIRMRGGEIHLRGDEDSITISEEFKGGKIFLNGKLYHGGGPE